MATPCIYDWNLIKNDYITDPGSSLSKISKKYGCSPSLVREHSRKEGWNKAKREQQEKIRQKTAEKLATKNANRLANELLAADLAGQAALKALKDPDQFRRHLVQKGRKGSIDTVEIVADKYDARAMKDMLSALKMVEDLKRSIGEIQRQSERQKHDIEQARLELERERLALERERLALQKQREGSGIDHDSYGVVELPPVIEQAPPAELMEEAEADE